jgi:hypothetical protein
MDENPKYYAAGCKNLLLLINDSVEKWPHAKPAMAAAEAMAGQEEHKRLGAN